MINKIILSPPFSNIYPNIKNTTRITGTYTLDKRPGLYRVITTLKKVENGWINNVGLRNPGIGKFNKNNTIISVSIQNYKEWYDFYNILKDKNKIYNIKGIEFNISCPNHNVSNVNSSIIKEAKELFNNTIIKIPHDIDFKEIEKILDLEADIIHVSNTKKVNSGGLSGKSLVNKNIENIKFIKSESDTNVIAGGGIYDFETFKKYYNIDADYFSLSTSLLNPLKSFRLINQMSQYLKLNQNHIS
tara:strand:- start:54 stop:788 length:735 start_codon:yes stop_codon:yes gene_type:complete